jgi:hypothetical protein
MTLDSVEVRNFRSIKHASLHCENLTALVGANGVGKSTFLRALEFFYNPSPRVSADDFHNGDTTAEITIGVTYRDLSPQAEELFERYVQGGRLMVERVIFIHAGKVTTKYHGATLQCGEFKPIRDGFAVKDRGRTARNAYQELQGQRGFADLPEWSTIGAAGEALTTWEAAHPESCRRERDDGQFFGFAGVGQGYLGRFTRLLYIPAVRDASSDGAESRGSVLSVLMDLVVRNALAQKPAVVRLQRRAQAIYERNFDPVLSPELNGLGERLP